MSFWAGLGNNLGNSFGRALGGGLASVGLGSAFGQSDGARKREARRERNAMFQQNYDMMIQGNAHDLKNQQKMFDFRYNRMQQAGLTNVEIFGSPASGAGGGTTGSAAMLGNAGASQASSIRQAEVQSREAEKDRMAGIVQTAMQTQAQKDVAEIGAGATTDAATISADANERIAGIVNEMAQKNLDLNTREFEEYMLQKLQIEQNVSKAEVKKLLNEASFTPEFKREITKMTMGVSNSVNLMLQKRFGIDVTSESDMQRLTPQQMKNVLHVFMAADSNLYTEIAGILGAASGKDDFNLDPIGEITGQPPKKLGKPSRGSLPGHIPRRGYN